MVWSNCRRFVGNPPPQYTVRTSAYEHVHIATSMRYRYGQENKPAYMNLTLSNKNWVINGQIMQEFSTWSLHDSMSIHYLETTVGGGGEGGGGDQSKYLDHSWEGGTPKRGQCVKVRMLNLHPNSTPLVITQDAPSTTNWRKRVQTYRHLGCHRCIAGNF